MKKLFVLCLIIASLSCNTNRQATTGGSQIGLKNLTHCYLKNSISLNSSYNGIVVSSADDFTNLFYTENAGAKQAIMPDFNGQLVVALALNTTDNSRVVFTKAETSRNGINVYGKLETVKKETESPVAIATVPKYLDAKTINFYIDGSLVKSIPASFKKDSNIFATAKEQPAKTQKQLRRKPVVI